MEYTAEQYLERIENKRLNSTPLYNREEMIDFAEKYAKQLTIHSVSNRREQLIAFAKNSDPYNDLFYDYELAVDSFLKESN